MMLIALANHSTRIAIAASPAPRNTALIRNSMTTVPLPPSMTRENDEPVRRTPSLAPISASICGPNETPIAPNATAATSPRMIDWTADFAAPSESFSPIRRATVADAPIDRPTASAYMIVIHDSVMPTVATASAPSRPTKKTSATTNTDPSSSRAPSVRQQHDRAPMGASV
jgi:hypothetical protein